MSLSTWLMNFLLMVAAYGLPLTPQDDAWEFDFNGNGFIDYSDILEMLALQPSPTELGVYEEKQYVYYMPKLVRVETDYHYYTVELTEEQYKLYEEDPDAFWDDDDLQEELYDNMELVRTKDAGTDYYVED